MTYSQRCLIRLYMSGFVLFFPLMLADVHTCYFANKHAAIKVWSLKEKYNLKNTKVCK